MQTTFEFHISRQARDRYNFDESLFSLTGNVLFTNFHGARVFAQKMNAKRDLVNFPELAVRAGQINAMGLIDEILHYVVGQYRQEKNQVVMGQALDWLYEQIGQDAVDKTLRQFAVEFPPLPVYRHDLDLDTYLNGESTLPGGDKTPNRQLVLEELLMLWLANINPGFSPYLELFDDASLEKLTAYLPVMAELHNFFDTQPFYGPDNQNLIDMLRAPALAHPHSLTAQLEFIRTRWGAILGKYIFRLLSSLDLIKEEEKIIFGVGGPGPAVVMEFAGLEKELERFSPDREWMPNLVLIAKNSYVWLDQLSKKYQRPIHRLNQIPDEELDNLRSWGFSGLWLIGLWERSAASKTIKQLRGNPEAVASAYSLFSYDIAADLGGEEAYRNLQERAWKRGIRLASDMVPNHMGIDSRWLVEHPDWFIALDYSPFPSYTFNGPNLSWDARVGIFLEDHYYNNTDAAVVFKRRDNWTGSEQYVYHGNDGTSMPWNDTAQLNYLKAEVREAVIQTILHVARKFPIIRFDAAMTLAKKHYQRLWYPEPGSGGDIPSRAEHGLTREQFDALFPKEFWREVVDRVAQEVPDTLLLAEAFWMMEGYFVRTLGMHRVYNSAFMNMLRDEKNQEYRLAIKNTLEFEPEILKRYVNFMNNPDERTAVDQFGKGDKYFGICTLMATMPGLPMFGHGQIEGYTEKYGMEFRRAYWDEHPDPYLVERHQREIFPLLRKRYLFAEVRDFLLYDFFTPEGYVNEDVFAYSNRAGDERSLVLYHNKYASTRGWIRTSVGFPVKTGSGEGRVMVQRNLGEGLGLHNDSSYYTIFRDQVNGLEYIRNSQELHSQGLYAELEAYKYSVFVDFREVHENEWNHYGQLAGYLNGRGVPSIDDALKEIFLQPVHNSFRELVNPGFFNWLAANRLHPEKPAQKTQVGEPFNLETANIDPVLDELEQKLRLLLDQVKRFTSGGGDPAATTQAVRAEIASLLSLPVIRQRFPSQAPQYAAALHFLTARLDGDLAAWGPLFAWACTHRLGEMLDPQSAAELSRTWVDEWLLGKIIAQALQASGVKEPEALRLVAILKLLIGSQGWWQAVETGKSSATQEGVNSQAYTQLKAWLNDSEIQHFLNVNRYQGILWFNKEAFDELLWWLFALAAVEIQAQAQAGGVPAASESGESTRVPQSPALLPVKENKVAEAILNCYAVIEKLKAAEEQSAFQVEKLLAAARR